MKSEVDFDIYGEEAKILTTNIISKPSVKELKDTSTSKYAHEKSNDMVDLDPDLPKGLLLSDLKWVTFSFCL